MKSRFAALVYAAAAPLCGASGPLAQEKTIDLNISHGVAPRHPPQKALEEWGPSHM